MMFSKSSAKGRIVLGHLADPKAAAVTTAMLSRLEMMRVDVGDLDSPADALEVLRRLAAEAPVMHGETFRRIA
jgi:proteasome assembly chaperone (PAC2) family protein